MKLKLIKKKISSDLIASLPRTIGIYVFWHNNTPIYIGKSVNLKERVKSYFSNSVWGKTLLMIKKATHISYLEVYSEFEALIVEAYLIKKHKPKYNISQKDDKTSLFIEITKDKYPLIRVVREKDIKSKIYFGPFQSSKDIKIILSQIRKVFPFSTHKLGKKACIYSQMGLCNPCPNKIEYIKNIKEKISLEKKYKYNIKMINSILSGHINKVRNILFKNMKIYSDIENYDMALQMKRKIELFDLLNKRRFSVEGYLSNPNFVNDIRKQEIESLKKVLSSYFNVYKLLRIECFDISHLQGNYTAASMVCFINGSEKKSEYRMFKIKQQKKGSDTDSLKEVIKRRIKYLKSWGKPDLVIVDGGKAQVNIFYKELDNYHIPVIGIAKREEKIILISKSKQFVKLNINKLPAINLIKRLRDESHRFAQRYHHKLIKMYYTKENNKSI